MTNDKDTRYNIPKEAPKASEELISKTIRETEIYRRVNLHILNAQRKQVAYGLDKYTEPLNANTWSIIETIDHIIDESIDKLHYLVMLRIKFEESAAKEMDEAEKHRDMWDALTYSYEMMRCIDTDGDKLVGLDLAKGDDSTVKGVTLEDLKKKLNIKSPSEEFMKNFKEDNDSAPTVGDVMSTLDTLAKAWEAVKND
jgi:hypothetical protein